MGPADNLTVPVVCRISHPQYWWDAQSNWNMIAEMCWWLLWTFSFSRALTICVFKKHWLDVNVGPNLLSVPPPSPQASISICPLLSRSSRITLLLRDKRNVFQTSPSRINFGSCCAAVRRTSYPSWPSSRRRGSCRGKLKPDETLFGHQMVIL